jgi:hypothetical protein
VSDVSRRSFDDPHGKSDAARQALLDNRDEHATKRHRTQKRAKALSAAKRERAAHRRAMNDAKRSKKLAAARAYWSGKGDHPK